MLLFKHKYQVWLSLSIVAAILFSLSGLKIAFQSPYIIQDDARQHIFWMQQFSDRNLFSNDLIADYFKSVTPLGFMGLYRLVSNLGVDVVLFNKISPLLIGIITTIYCFLTSFELFPVPFAGFISCLLLNQNLWMVDDLSSGTPRAFIYVLLLAFIYYLLRQNIAFCLIAILLQGLFYPQAVLISLLILSIRLLLNLKFSKIEVWGILVSVIILAVYSLKTSDFAPVISKNQAQLSPEFLVGGRTAFFNNVWYKFWLRDQRSGFFPIELQYTLLCTFGFILWEVKKHPNYFPLVKEIKPQIKILLQLFLASISLFFLAHFFLFHLHLPSRYTHHTIRIILALIDGVAIAVLFHGLILWLKNRVYFPQITKFLGILILFSVLLYPTYAVKSYPRRLGYVIGESQQLYQFLAQQPKDILIATLSKEADFIPGLAKRSVLAAREYAIPYHRGYYNQIKQRVKDLVQAQYSTNQQVIVRVIEKYNINLWLISKNAFAVEYLARNSWLQQFQPETNQAIETLSNQQKPILENYSNLCTILETEKHNVLDANCLLDNLK